MKKLLMFLLAFCCILFSACGSKDDTSFPEGNPSSSEQVSGDSSSSEGDNTASGGDNSSSEGDNSSGGDNSSNEDVGSSSGGIWTPPSIVG